jgi:hypothetical protein
MENFSIAAQHRVQPTAAGRDSAEIIQKAAAANANPKGAEK